MELTYGDQCAMHIDWRRTTREHGLGQHTILASLCFDRLARHLT